MLDRWTEYQVILFVFVALTFTQLYTESFLSRLHLSFIKKKENRHLARELDISDEDLDKAILYSTDRLLFGEWERRFQTFFFLIMLLFGVYGTLHVWSLQFESQLGSIGSGVLFLGCLFLIHGLVTLPWSYYQTFVIEEKHGFNKQSKKNFFIDALKSSLLSAVFVGGLLFILLWVKIQLGDYWWLVGWATVVCFALFLSWAFPNFIAPLFNKFTPLSDGALKDKINELAKKAEFPAGEVFVIDASKRSGHANAYFAGSFGKKKIVLYDTLIDKLTPTEIQAVLAHELGHFKNKDTWKNLFFASLSIGLFFYAVHLTEANTNLYRAFGIQTPTQASCLWIVTLWYGTLGFWLSPLRSFLSRKAEFRADAYSATMMGSTTSLYDALLKLRKHSNGTPYYHPLYSLFYLSHPPLTQRLERLKSHRVTSP